VVARLLATAVDPSSVANEVEAQIVRGLPDPDTMIGVVAEITRNDIAAALAALLDRGQTLRLLVGTRSAIGASYRALGVEHGSWQQ